MYIFHEVMEFQMRVWKFRKGENVRPSHGSFPPLASSPRTWTQRGYLPRAVDRILSSKDVNQGCQKQYRFNGDNVKVFFMVKMVLLSICQMGIENAVGVAPIFSTNCFSSSPSIPIRRSPVAVDNSRRGSLHLFISVVGEKMRKMILSVATWQLEMIMNRNEYLLLAEWKVYRLFNYIRRSVRPFVHISAFH